MSLRTALVLSLLALLVCACPTANDDDVAVDDDDLFADDDDQVDDDDQIDDDDSGLDDDDSAGDDDDSAPDDDDQIDDDDSGLDDDDSAGDDDDSAPAWDFERFVLNSSAGPCPPGADCQGFIELLDDATLQVDKFGEVPPVVHSTTITPQEFDATVPLLVNPALIALLDLPEPPCEAPTDVFESMLLEQAAVDHQNTTTACADEQLSAVRTALFGLATTYFP